MSILRLTLAGFFLLGSILTTAEARRPADIEESLHASSMQRLVSGMRYGLDMVWSIVAMPSQEHVEQDVVKTRISVYFVGLGRTGTTSLASAMNILGYKTLHDDELDSVADLYGAFYGHKITEDELHEKIGQRGFNCSFDYSGYKWAAKQDDVKVILTTRDPEKWVDSWLTVADVADIIIRPPFSWFQSIKDISPLFIETCKNIPTGGHPEGYLDRETLLRGYQAHVDVVRRTVPPERLLLYNVKQGWQPLCEFLDVPVPDVPFPHINDRLKVRAILMAFRIITWIWPLFIILPLLLVWWLVVILSKLLHGQSVKKKQS